MIPDNCLDIDNTGKCVRCAPGFVPNGNICQSTDVNCLFFNNQERCSQCRDGYYIDTQGKCQVNTKNCTISDNTGRCTQCFAGFTLQNGKCYRQYSFCSRYSEAT